MPRVDRANLDLILLEEAVWVLVGFESVSQTLGLPIFLKGSRQTSRHRAALSIIHSAAAYDRAIEIYAADPILQWQDLGCREFVGLRPVPSTATEKIPASFCCLY